MVDNRIKREAFFFSLITLILVIGFIIFALSSCSTKKKINTQKSKTQTESTINKTTETHAIIRGTTQSSSQELREILERSEIRFDSISTIILRPDGNIEASGRNVRIQHQRISSTEKNESVLIDTTRSEHTAQRISEEKKERVITEDIQKDIKRKTSIVGFLLVFGLIALAVFVIRGLKNIYIP
jgi:nitrous oxide reductase